MITVILQRDTELNDIGRLDVIWPALAAPTSRRRATGTVINQARAGVPGECVTAIPVAPRVDPFGGILQAPEVAVTTSSGRYTLADLPPGQYKAEFTIGCGATGCATQWWDNATSGRSAKVITVGFATVGMIDAALRR